MFVLLLCYLVRRSCGALLRVLASNVIQLYNKKATAKSRDERTKMRTKKNPAFAGFSE